MTCTKADLIESLTTVLGVKKEVAKKLVAVFFETISSTLEAGAAVKLAKIGNFTVRNKSQRPGRNPKTNESIPISARRVVSFRASPKLKQYVAIKHPAWLQNAMTQESERVEDGVIVV